MGWPVSEQKGRHMTSLELSHGRPLAPRAIQISAPSSRVPGTRSALALFGCPGSLSAAVGLNRASHAAVKIPDIRIELRSKRIPGTREDGFCQELQHSAFTLGFAVLSTGFPFKDGSRVRGGNLTGIGSEKARA
jgi:hypothetical protein